MNVDQVNACVPECLRRYQPVPAAVLSMSTRHEIGRYLDSKQGLSPTTRRLQDWWGLAEELGFTTIECRDFERQQSPTVAVLDKWLIVKSDATIGHILSALCQMERFDLIHDVSFHACLDRDVGSLSTATQPVQVPKDDSSDDDEKLTVTEVQTGLPETFDAFLCYSDADGEFVQQLIYQLEDVYKLKLCIADRDLLLGGYKLEDKIKLISSRCHKLIAVLSPAFNESNECRFLTNFAVTLPSTVTDRKIIPVKCQQCQVPQIISILTTVDFTRTAEHSWLWKRLAASLKPQNSGNNRTFTASTSTLSSESGSNAFFTSSNATSSSGYLTDPGVSLSGASAPQTGQSSVTARGDSTAAESITAQSSLQSTAQPSAQQKKQKFQSFSLFRR